MDDMRRNDLTNGEDQTERERRKLQKKRRTKTWNILRPILVLVISISICAFVAVKLVNKVLVDYCYPVDPGDATPITITIPSGTGASGIAKILYEACGEGEEGLISNKAVFKVYVDFTGKSSILKAGTYILSKNMDITQMVDVICEGNPPKETVRVTVPEGASVEDIAKKLVEAGILADTSKFLELCKTAQDFTGYSFVEAIEQNPEQARDYVLEGYLFPDTYEFYVDASEKTIINKMLMQFQAVFTDEYIERAKELGMSIDEVVTMASLIEKEAKVTSDFSKVSAVLHNRIETDMTLGLDASLKYIYKDAGLGAFSETEKANASLYNTYKYTGLGLGPITNPGQTALEAALYPNEDYIEEKYLYFVLMDGTTGELAYAKTLEEHEANTQKYKQYWSTQQED